MLQIQLDLSYEVKPVFFVDPLRLNSSRYVMAVRRDFEWDCLVSGSCLDATDSLPTGSHDAYESKANHIAAATCARSLWVL